MAITITIAEIAAAIRVDDSAEETAEVSRIRDYAVVAISQHLGDAYADAPVAVVNMAATLLCGWLYDKPTTTGGFSFANAIKFSGAIRVLFPYKAHSVGLVGGRGVAAATAAGIGSTGNPVVDVDIIGDDLVITYADGSTETHALPAGGGGGGGGFTAADIMALIASHAAMPEIHHIQGGSSLIVGNIIDGRLPGTPIAMRMGWGETNPPMANVFTRDNNHPYDGAAVGTSELTYMPPFPPALVDEHTLFVFIWLEGSPVDAAIWVNPGLDNQGDFSAFFTDGAPLEVEGVAGTVYVSIFQFSSNESQGYASPQPGPLLATQTWVTAEIANIMLSGGGITTAQAQALIDTAVVNFQTDSQVATIVADALNALPDWQTLTEVNTLISNAIAALTLGQTAAQVAALISLHAAIASAHHVKTPAGGGGGGDPVLLGTATAVGTPIFLQLTGTEADTIIAAYNAGTYPGGYRMTLVWDVGLITHGVVATLPADLFGTLVNGKNYYFHIDASAALDATVSRYLSLARVPAQDGVQVTTLPTADDFEAGTVFTLWGLP